MVQRSVSRPEGDSSNGKEEFYGNQLYFRFNRTEEIS